MTSRTKIIQGHVPSAVSQQFNDSELAHWASLTDTQREQAYDNAITDHRLAHAYENGFLGNMGGQGVARGRHGCLVHAIEQAYTKSDAHKAQLATEQAEADAEQVCCWECDTAHRKDGELVFMGDMVICYSCCWNKYPASADMLGIPQPSV